MSPRPLGGTRWGLKRLRASASFQAPWPTRFLPCVNFLATALASSPLGSSFSYRFVNSLSIFLIQTGSLQEARGVRKAGE